ETSQKYSKQINLLFLHLQKMSEEPEINKDCDREVYLYIQIKHGSNHVGLPENLADGAAAGNGDDGLIPQSKSRTPGSQQFPDTENEECHSDEQNDTRKQISEEQSTGISQDEILTNKQKQIEVAEKKMNSELSPCPKKEKDLLHENSTLQEEIAMLRLELDTMKHQSQLREEKYLEEIESEKKENDDLLKAMHTRDGDLVSWGLVVAWSAWAGSLVSRSRGAIHWRTGHMGPSQQGLVGVSSLVRPLPVGPWSGQLGQWNLIRGGLVREDLVSGGFCSAGRRGDLVIRDLSSRCLFSGTYLLGSQSGASGHLRPG
ncbi:hypothetical protein H8959_012904, partial [Pygathrix nigripes]